MFTYIKNAIYNNDEPSMAHDFTTWWKIHLLIPLLQVVEAAASESRMNYFSDENKQLAEKLMKSYSLDALWIESNTLASRWSIEKYLDEAQWEQKNQFFANTMNQSIPKLYEVIVKFFPAGVTETQKDDFKRFPNVSHITRFVHQILKIKIAEIDPVFQEKYIKSHALTSAIAMTLGVIANESSYQFKKTDVMSVNDYIIVANWMLNIIINSFQTPLDDSYLIMDKNHNLNDLSNPNIVKFAKTINPSDKLLQDVQI